MENIIKTSTEYRNDYFGTFTRLGADGLYARGNHEEKERLIFYLGAPAKRDPSRPICDRINLTPDYIDCHYGPAVVRFEAQRG